MRFLALISLLLPVLSFAQQTVFSWEDADGVTHYADSAKAVPLSAKKVQQFRLEKVSADSAKPAATEPKTVADSTPPRDSSTLVVHNSGGAVWQDVGGLSESQWRDRFIQAFRRIKELETAVANEKAAPTPTTRTGLERAREVLNQKTMELQEAKDDLDQLERTASNNNVPREWRRGF